MKLVPVNISSLPADKMLTFISRWHQRNTPDRSGFSSPQCALTCWFQWRTVVCKTTNGPLPRHQLPIKSQWHIYNPMGSFPENSVSTPEGRCPASFSSTPTGQTNYASVPAGFLARFRKRQPSDFSQHPKRGLPAWQQKYVAPQTSIIQCNAPSPTRSESQPWS